MLQEPTMTDETDETDETVEKVRTGLELLRSRLGSIGLAEVRDMLALLPPKSKPEAAPGPYEVTKCSTGGWRVTDAKGVLLAWGLREPTARVLASGPGSLALLERLRDCLAVRMDSRVERGWQMESARKLIVEHLKGVEGE